MAPSELPADARRAGSRGDRRWPPAWRDSHNPKSPGLCGACKELPAGLRKACTRQEPSRLDATGHRRALRAKVPFPVRVAIRRIGYRTCGQFASDGAAEPWQRTARACPEPTAFTFSPDFPYTLRVFGLFIVPRALRRFQGPSTMMGVAFGQTVNFGFQFS